MNKKQLNQEIVLFRPLVKKSRVCTIRKLVKKIKILRSCKNEALKEKKLKKARRLVAEIHVMKTLRPDYVTKFALLTEDFEYTGSNSKLKRKRNACAKLAKNKKLVQKINMIRNMFTDWREELPRMLASKKSKRLKPEKEAKKGVVIDSEKIDPQERTGNNCEVMTEKENVNIFTGDSLEKETEPFVSGENDQKKKVRCEKKKNGRRKKREMSGGESPDEEISTKNDVHEPKEPQIRVDDPFFIGKKVLAPKLIPKPEDHAGERKGSESRLRGEEISEAGKEMERSVCRKPSKPAKRVSFTGIDVSSNGVDDDLHPSWKAKKMETIRPFEGKKIKFED